MTLAPPTVAELATFTGRASNTFGEFAPEALAQSTLLFYLATGLEDYPSDTNLALLVKYGIMEMADNIYLSQPYKEDTVSPFQSETIGTYSYSKTVKAVRKGDSTGIMWFDLAVNKLKIGGSGIGASGSIEGFEWDGLTRTTTGRSKIVGATGSRPEYTTAWEIDTEEVIHHHPII